MKELNRGSALRVVIPLFVTLPFLLSGCGGANDDLSRASQEGTALKTPSDALKDSYAEHGGAPEKGPAKAAPGKKGAK